jgi:hypothetical protein
MPGLWLLAHFVLIAQHLPPHLARMLMRLVLALFRLS